jgi:hypothetical protein
MVTDCQAGTPQVFMSAMMILVKLLGARLCSFDANRPRP